MPALQIHNDPTATIQPIAEKHINGNWSQFIQWSGRLLDTLFMRHGAALSGGIDKVATTFKAKIDSTLVWSQTHRAQGEHTLANDALYDLAYDLTFMNKSQIDALALKLEARPDALENDALLATFKRAEMIAKLPPIKQAIQNVLIGFDAKVRAARPVAIVPDVVVEAPPAPAPVPEAAAPAPVDAVPLEGASPQARLDCAATRAARTMLTPNQRHDNATGIRPTLTTEKLVLSEFRRSLEVAKPDYTAVQALGEHLDHQTGPKARKLLEKLSLMAQLYLYEVTTKHQDLLVACIVENYNAQVTVENQTAEEKREVFRSYLTLHKRNPLVNGRYVALLDKIRS